MSNVAEYSENSVVGDMPIGFGNIKAIVLLTNEVSIRIMETETLQTW